MKLNISLEIDDATLATFGQQLSDWNATLVQIGVNHEEKQSEMRDPARIFAALEPHLLRLVPIFFPRKYTAPRSTMSKPLDEDIKRAVKVLDFLEEIGPPALLIGPMNMTDVDRNLLVDRFHGIIEKYRTEGVVVTRAWLQQMLATLITYLPSFGGLRSDVLQEIVENIVKMVEDAGLLPQAAPKTAVPDFEVVPPSEDGLVHMTLRNHEALCGVTGVITEDEGLVTCGQCRNVLAQIDEDESDDLGEDDPSGPRRA